MLYPVTILDNFFEEPDKIVDLALNTEYSEITDGRWPGVRSKNLSEINEFYIGRLITMSIMETVATCLYFEVDPFNQPAVEQGKKLTKKYLSQL